MFQSQRLVGFQKCALHSRHICSHDPTGPTEVLIKLNATGICHSDLHVMANDWNTPKMSAFGTKCSGHEGAGVIVKVGDQVKTLRPGMRAGFKVSRPRCRNNHIHLHNRQF